MHESANIWEQGQLLLLVRDKRLLEGVDPFSVGLSGSERKGDIHSTTNL